MLPLQQIMPKTILAILGSVLLTLSSVALADILPGVAKPRGDKCVAPTDEMRAIHFEKILHQRDDTMHKGIRTKTNSLKECINCHVPENTTVRFGDDKHFCSSCHNQAAVTIDCFQCHADRPGNIPAIHKAWTAKKNPHLNTEATAPTGTEATATGAAP
jgi:hypothetical protein